MRWSSGRKRRAAASPAPEHVAGPVASDERLITLDVIRGLAVLGILFANIVGFAHPQFAYGWPPALPGGLEPANKAVWLAQYLLIDGKMRGLFTLLFGAGMALFLDRAAERGDTRFLQVRRLGWLMLFGLLHYYLLFWGDILLLYGLCGFAVLPLVRLPAPNLLGIGIVWYVFGGLFMALTLAGPASVEQSAALQGFDSAAYRAGLDVWQSRERQAAFEAAVFVSGSYAREVAYMIEVRSGELADLPFFAAIETIPLMLIGMALYRYGFFAGGIDRAVMRRWGWAGVAAGIALPLPFGLWAMVRDFPPWLTELAVSGIPQIPRLPMILGLAALLACWAETSRSGWLATRLAAAGRMAFSNYIGTSILMMLVFRSWAGGLYGEMDRMELLLPVVLGWAVMLRWSTPWLKRFRYGPLEWLWRCLTYWKLFPMRR